MFEAIFTAIGNWYDRVMPAFWLRLKPSYQWAFGIAIVAALWVASGQIMHLVSGGRTPASDTAQARTASDIPRVQVMPLVARLRDATVTVRGRTQALHEVDVRAEVEGVVQAIHFDKGQRVKQGDVLCEIKLNDRSARVAQAQAMVDQTAKELAVAQELYKDGFRSKTQMAAAEANYEQAKAVASTNQIALDNTRIRAPFDGVVDDRYVDVGDYMKIGDKCEMVIAPEPFLAVGAVSEQDVGQLRVGDPATATLVTGQTVQGKISFVADRSDPSTHTFRIEVELPNPDNTLRDGVSADIHVPVRQIAADHISPGILVLDDKEVVGLRAVVSGTVRFYPVQIIADGPDGMWVAGLPNNLDVITVGQEFVNDGERVETFVSGRMAS